MKSGTTLKWRMRPLVRDPEVKPFQDPVEILTPGNGHGGRSHRVFQNKVPTYNPGDQLTHRRIGVSVSTARYRYHGGELGIAKASKSAADTSNYKSQHD